VKGKEKTQTRLIHELHGDVSALQSAVLGPTMVGANYYPDSHRNSYSIPVLVGFVAQLLHGFTALVGSDCLL
jgi:hypothetical protein